MIKSCLSCDEDKGIIYSNRVLIGNWFEATKLEEQMKKGDLMLARYRKMTDNIMKPTDLTQSTGSICFGAKICLLAPHAPSTDPPVEGKTGLLLGGRISSNEINYSQELQDGCSVVSVPNLKPCERSAFVITSADYCNRDNEQLKYNQEFLLASSSSVLKNQPLYLRYDPNPIPGLCGMFPLYLSEHPVSNARWRLLPLQRPDITRFEQEGKSVQVNTDLIVNHCATNINLGIGDRWTQGFAGKICAPLMKTCLDVYGRELPNNIWQIYVPIEN